MDTGVGVHSLPRYLLWSGLRCEGDTKPLQVVLTHCHFDHSGGAHQFPLVRLHPSEAEYVRRGDQYMTASWVTPEEVIPKPEGWSADHYCALPASVDTLEDGEMIELGDRVLRAHHIPGHSPGSLALHDADNGVLVTGDTLYDTDHGLIDWYPGSDSAAMGASVTRLLELISSSGVGLVCPGHNDVMDGDTAIRAGHTYLEQNTTQRRITKFWSRRRAEIILKSNKYFRLPRYFKETLAN